MVPCSGGARSLAACTTFDCWVCTAGAAGGRLDVDLGLANDAIGAPLVETPCCCEVATDCTGATRGAAATAGDATTGCGELEVGFGAGGELLKRCTKPKTSPSELATASMATVSDG